MQCLDVPGDDGWYIADTFGTADSRFGKSLSKEKPTLSTYLKDLSKSSPSTSQYSWVKSFLLSKDLPTAQSWVSKYGSKPLLYEKDLKVAYNAVRCLVCSRSYSKKSTLLRALRSRIQVAHHLPGSLCLSNLQVTQLGAEFTGGKYESLLKNRKRKSLNDDSLDFL